MQIDVGSTVTVYGVVTQGRADYDQWVMHYKVQTRIKSVDECCEDSWNDVPPTAAQAAKSGSAGSFPGNTDRNTEVRNLFAKPLRARYVRFVPTRFKNWVSMRAALLACAGCQFYNFHGSHQFDQCKVEHQGTVCTGMPAECDGPGSGSQCATCVAPENRKSKTSCASCNPGYYLSYDQCPLPDIGCASCKRECVCLPPEAHTCLHAFAASLCAVVCPQCVLFAAATSVAMQFTLDGGPNHGPLVKV